MASPTPIHMSAASCPGRGRPRQDCCKGGGMLHFPVSEPPDGHAAALPRSYPQQPLQGEDCPEEELGRYRQGIFVALLYRGLQCLRTTVPSLGKCLCKEERKKRLCLWNGLKLQGRNWTEGVKRVISYFCPLEKKR